MSQLVGRPESCDISDESWNCPECSAVGFAATDFADVTTSAGDGPVHFVGVSDGLVPPGNLYGLGSMDVNHVEFSLFI